MNEAHPSFTLEGRKALVTGSSQGIGLGLAGALAAAGAQVVLNGRDPARLKAAVDALNQTGPSVAGVAFDVTMEDTVAVAAAEIGPVDILINNAGIHRRSLLAEMSLPDWEQVLSTNLTSAFLVTRAFIGSMIERRAGKIINICSLMSDLARPTTGNYAAAKGGLRMLTRAMCAEWAQYNIQVNGIGPGYIETKLTAPLRADEEFDRWVKSRTPAGRWGRVTDLTGTAVFLASSASDYLNGQVLMVDGGLTAVV